MSEAVKQKVAVLGAGSWGMAVARHLDRLGHNVCLWEFDTSAAIELARSRVLPSKLPGIRLPDRIVVSNDLAQALNNSAVIVFVTPSTAIRATAAKVSELGTTDALVIEMTKGIDVQTGERMTQIIGSEMSCADVVALVGPSHAEEVARDVPTALVAASNDATRSRQTQDLFSCDRMRVYTSDDPVGVELGAALKNIVAIAAGMVDGLGYESADNIKGALVTRGLAEITRLGAKMGAKPETFAGLSGVGDLVTTCLSKNSRNRYVGEQIGRGKTLTETLAGMSMVAEGVTTTQAALRLAERYQVDMPIARAVSSVLFDGVPAVEAVAALMKRPAQPEIRR